MSSTLRNSLILAGMLAAIAGGGIVYEYQTHAAPLPIEQFEGTKPALPDPAPETLPEIALLKTVGWAGNAAPTPAKGLAVNRFAQGLVHPRTMLTLPNGDVLVAETDAPADNGPSGVVGFFQHLFMRIVGAGGHSPNTIVLLRDSKGTGQSDPRFDLRRDGMVSP